MIRFVLAAALLVASSAAYAQGHGWGPLGQPGPNYPTQPKCYVGPDGRTVICR